MKEAIVSALGAALLLGVGLFYLKQDGKNECIREGIRAGWATEAIKELCK